MINLAEPLEDLYTSSKYITLDFSNISKNTPISDSIESYFHKVKAFGDNPRSPENRQAFNNELIESSSVRYLIGRYGEDRSAMLLDTPAGKEGRTIHMAVDIFSKNLEPVFSPCDGQVVESGYEEGFGEYGNYLIVQPKVGDYFIFMGHLSSEKIGCKAISKGQQIAALGDYVENENGGWSRHLHLQILKELPNAGTTPSGYSTREKFELNKSLFPDPLQLFSDWVIQS
ncbi:MAG: hypothetical protein QG628_482 [Patescibacteria group bacterium]|nr:hypothetical protein [Patescibacteria group bacterium]